MFNFNDDPIVKAWLEFVQTKDILKLIKFMLLISAVTSLFYVITYLILIK